MSRIKYKMQININQSKVMAEKHCQHCLISIAKFVSGCGHQIYCPDYAWRWALLIPLFWGKIHGKLLAVYIWFKEVLIVYPVVQLVSIVFALILNARGGAGTINQLGNCNRLIILRSAADTQHWVLSERRLPRVMQQAAFVLHAHTQREKDNIIINHAQLWCLALIYEYYTEWNIYLFLFSAHK